MKTNRIEKIHASLVKPQAYRHRLDRLCLAEKIMRAEQEIQRGKSLNHSQVEKLSKIWIK